MPETQSFQAEAARENEFRDPIDVELPPLEQPPVPNSPTNLPPESVPINVTLVSADIHDQARDQSEQRIQSETAGKGIKGIISRIWKGNLARDYYSNKYTRQAERTIAEEGVVNAATIERFAQELDLIHGEAGEVRAELDNNEHDQALKEQIKATITHIIEGGSSEEALEAAQEEVTRIIQGAAEIDPAFAEKGRVFGNNLLLAAKQVETRVNAGETMEEVMEGMKFYLGQAREGARTEVAKSGLDRTLEWMKEHHLAFLTNEAVVITGVSIAYSIGRWSAKTAAGAGARMLIPGAGAGFLAGIREHYRFGQEWRVHSREMATGGQFDEADKRRTEMEEARYETLGARDLTDSLRSHLEPEGNPRPLTAEEYDRALHDLVTVKQRIQLSDRESMDLISYSHPDRVESERLGLDLAVAELQVSLRRQVGNSSTEFSDILAANGGDFEAALAMMLSVGNSEISTDVEAKQATLKSMRRRHVTKAAVKGVLFGSAIGLSVNVVRSLASGGNGFEAMMHQYHLGGEPKGARIPPHLLHSLLNPDGKHLHTTRLGNGNVVKMPNGYHFVHEKGGYTLESGKDKVLATDLHFRGGVLDQASQEKLSQDGFFVDVKDHAIGHTETKEVTVTDREFVKDHADGMVRVKRELWYDNDTRDFDQNELKLWWGGADNSGLDAKGDYVFNVAHMSPDGSFHDQTAANFQRLIAEHKLTVNLSISEGTQNHVFSFQVDANGNAIIPKDSEAARLLFRNDGGHAEFVGRYAEVAQVTNVTNGVEHVRMLATYSGQGVEKVHTEVGHNVITHHKSTIIKAPVRTPAPPPTEPAPTPEQAEYLVPPVIPVFPRRTLEPIKASEAAAEVIENKTTPEPPSGPERRALPAESVVGGPKDIELRRATELPLDPESYQTLFDLKEQAREAVGNLKNVGFITPAERRLIAANLGRITQHMEKKAVTQTDLYSLFWAFAVLTEAWPDRYNESEFNRIKKSLLKIDRDLLSQSEKGWQMGKSADTVYPADSPLDGPHNNGNDKVAEGPEKSDGLESSSQEEEPVSEAGQQAPQSERLTAAQERNRRISGIINELNRSLKEAEQRGDVKQVSRKKDRPSGYLGITDVGRALIERTDNEFRRIRPSEFSSRSTARQPNQAPRPRRTQQRSGQSPAGTEPSSNVESPESQPIIGARYAAGRRGDAVYTLDELGKNEVRLKSVDGKTIRLRRAEFDAKYRPVE